jgi:hypothetical protein
MEIYKYITSNWKEYQLERKNNLYVLSTKTTKHICDVKFLNEIKKDIKKWGKLILQKNQ